MENMEKINIELSKEQELEVRKYAKMLDITIEEFIVRAIINYIFSADIEAHD